MRFAFAFLLIGGLSSTVSTARADNYYDQIFRIESTYGKERVELTGFKVRERPGIYTALHGVVGSDDIVGFRPTPKRTLRHELVIAEVDIDRDIAYLVPKDRKAKLPGGGLPVGRAPRMKDLAGKTARVVGYPIGLDLLAPSTPLTVRRPAATSLAEAVNATARKALLKRNSPALSTRVVMVDGNLLPGHSGAPILDEHGYVVAIGNGGLDKGRVGLGWGIPFHDVEPVPIAKLKNNERFVSLAKSKQGFALFCVIDDQARERAKAIRIETRSVIVSPDGGPVFAFPMTPQKAIVSQLKRLKEVLEMMRKGEGEKLSPWGEFQRLQQKLRPLAVGTEVKVLDVKGADEGGARPMLPFPLPGAQGKKQDPFAQLGSVLGGAANQVNVKVKVLSGWSKGQELWVHSSAIRRETILREEK